MATDPATVYAQKVTALELAEMRAKELVERVKSFAEAMTDWRRVIVRGGPGVSAPDFLSVTNPANRTVDVSEWPSSKDVRDALTGWHEAAGEVRKAYDAIPEEVRKHMANPAI